MSYGTGVFYTLNEDRSSYALQGINGIRLRQFANGYDRAAVISDQGKISWVCGGPEPGSEMEQIFDSLKVVSITFSKDFAILLDEDGKLYSWGINKSGQLGHGHLDDLLIPHNIDMISRFHVTQVACSETHCACVTKTGGIYTWGRGFEGQTGLFYSRPMNDNYPQGITLKPTYISFFTGKNVKKVACGADFTVVLTEDGSLYTFGNNNLGQLGSGNKNRSYFPLFIVSGEDRKFEDISCGVAHTMARTTEGEVFGWGSNLFGQLGFPKEQKLILGPQKLIINETIGDFYDISCSNNVSSVVDFEGHVWVMGYRNTPVFNQYKDVLISDTNILPPTLLNYKDNYLTNHVSIGYQHMLIFVPTYISEIVPSTGPLAGDSPIVLKGCGFFNYLNIPITVRFNFGPQQPVQYITGFYDPESDTITCNTPPCQPEEIKIEMSDSEEETDTDEDSSRKNSAREKAKKEEEERKRKKEEDAAKELSIAASIDICLNGEDFTDEGIQFEYYVTPKINNIIPVNCQCDIPTIISFYATSYGKAPTDNIKIMFEEIIEQPPKEEPKVEEEEEEEIISNSSDEDEENESKKEIMNEEQSEGKVSEMPSTDDSKAQTVFVNEENKEGEVNEKMNMNELGSEIQQSESQQQQPEGGEEVEEEPESTEPHQIVIQAFMNEVPITDPSCEPILKDYPELQEQLQEIRAQQEAERLFQLSVQQQQLAEEQRQQKLLEEQQQVEQQQLEEQPMEQSEEQPQENVQPEQQQPEEETQQSVEEQQPEHSVEQEQLLPPEQQQQLEEQQQQFSNIPTLKILQCTTPVLDFPIKKPMRCKVKIAMNGMNFDDIEGFEFIFFDIKLKSVIPGYISSEGGYLLNINGSGFVSGLTHQLRLQYGEEVTHYDCEFVNGNLLTLSAPKLDMTCIPPPPTFEKNNLPSQQPQEGGEGNEDNNETSAEGGEEKKEEVEEEEKKEEKEETKEEGDEEKQEEENKKEETAPEVKKDCLRQYEASITCNGRNYSNTYPYIVYSGEFTDISPRFGQKEGGTLVSIIPNSPILHELTPEQSEFIKVTIKSKTQEETLPAVFNVEKQCIEFTTPKLIEIEPPPEAVQPKGKAAEKAKPDKGKKGKKDAKKESPRMSETATAAGEEVTPEPEIIVTDPIMKLIVSLNQYENIQLSDEIVYTYLPIPELVAAKPNTLKPDGSVNFTGNGFVQSKDIKFKIVSDYLLEPVYVDGTCSDDCKTIQATFPALPPQQNDDPKLKKSGYPARISVTLNLQEYSNEINVTIKF